MSKNLITLLGGGTSAQLALQELRTMTGDGLDVKLIADILSKAHEVMRRLGLDPADTTPQEVYNALINAIETEQWLSLLQETDYVLLDVDGEVISFNPIDVIDNYHLQLPLNNRKTSAAQKGLGWEITKRYRKHPRTSEQRVNRVAEKAELPTEEPLFCRILFNKPSILVIGDIASESLITFEDANAEVVGARNDRKIAFNLGSRVACQGGHVIDASGSAANVAVAFSKLGIQPSLMSWLGGDTAGGQSLIYLQKHGVDMSGVSVDKHSRSNYHYVLRHGTERTILASYEKFHYVWRDPACQPDWVFLSMISDDSWEVHQSLVQFLNDNPTVKLAFQPGAAHFNWGKEKLTDIYRRSEIVIMNVDEAMSVTGRKARNIPTLLKSISILGAKSVVLTDGPKGAYVLDDHEVFKVPGYPDPSSPQDRTGAGDAFAATLVAELSKGKSLKDALLRAPINSMSVVQYVGAQAGLLTSKQVDEYLQFASEEYQVSPVLVD